MRTCCLSLMLVLGIVGVRAQDSPTLFRGGIDLVSISVVVTDAQERFVSGLTASDFIVLEDGVPQDVSFFAASAVPIDLAILLDTSSSMSDKLQTVQDAAIGFASTARPGDRITVVDIKDTVRVLHPLSEDVAAARAAILNTKARGGTAIYNGVYMTLREIMKRSPRNGEVRRAAIVLLSDGDDTASLLGFEDVLDVAKRAGVAIYTIMLKSDAAVRQAAAGGHRYFSEGTFGMKSLAQETGARSFSPRDISELAGVYGLIAADLANQYELGYTPTNQNADGKYRRLMVRVNHPGARTRARAGYIGSGKTHALTR